MRKIISKCMDLTVSFRNSYFKLVKCSFLLLRHTPADPHWVIEYDKSLPAFTAFGCVCVARWLKSKHWGRKKNIYIYIYIYDIPQNLAKELSCIQVRDRFWVVLTTGELTVQGLQASKRECTERAVVKTYISIIQVHLHLLKCLDVDASK